MPHRAFDHVQIRCPMLGGPVTFSYCRQVTDGLPCHKALICFERQFPVDEYFRRVLHADTFERCFVAPTGCRYEKLLGAVQSAQTAADAVVDHDDDNDNRDGDNRDNDNRGGDTGGTR
jgi:hypothetical protein